MKLSEPAVNFLCAVAFGGFSYAMLILVILWAHFYPGPEKGDLITLIRICVGAVSGTAAAVCTIWTANSIYEWAKEHLT